MSKNYLTAFPERAVTFHGEFLCQFGQCQNPTSKGVLLMPDLPLIGRLYDNLPGSHLLVIPVCEDCLSSEAFYLFEKSS